MHFELVHAADPRYQGGTSAALRSELKAARLYGLSTALLPFLGRRSELVARFEHRVTALVDELALPWLTSDTEASCDLLLAHHPHVFEHMPAERIALRPRHVICVLHHPPFDGTWRAQYDIHKVVRNLETMFGAPVSVAPVGPKVRAQLRALAGSTPSILDRDLNNLIDLSEWEFRPRSPVGGHAVIGRHSRPSPLKWPDTPEELLSAYPNRRNVTVRVLGGIPDTMEGWIGSNWQLLSFSEQPTHEFLTGLNFFVYFHSRAWIEAFGISIAEAMASGTVAILDHSFQTLFEDGPLYAEPAAVCELLERMLTSPEAYQRHALAGRKIVEEKFSFDTYPERMRALYRQFDLKMPAALIEPRARSLTADATSPPAPRQRRPRTKPRRILFVATNGIGLGHVTRLMAIAERMSKDIVPIFFTRSAGAGLVRDRGHGSDYIPSPMKFGVTDTSWNRAHAQELLAAIETLDVAGVVFDGPQPFPGLRRVAAVRQDLSWVWVRRAMWRDGHRFDPKQQASFDMVIEPGELAGDEDYGPTTKATGSIVHVGPILLNHPDDKLPRIAAAAALGLNPDRFTAAIQLGSQRNFEYDVLPKSILHHLAQRGAQIVVIVNPLAPPLEAIAGVVCSRVYPLSKHFAAIDLMITNAGYNSFHECVYAGIPTIFVPNEAPEMDDQTLRASFAHTAHLGLRLRRTEISTVGKIIETATSEVFRGEVRRRAAQLNFIDGGREAAEAIEELVFSVAGFGPLHTRLPRA